MKDTNTSPLKILLVDDQDQKLLAYEAMLDGLGETLLRAQNGNQALEILLRDEVAVILLDVNMPGLDGFETAALIRQHPRFTRTPIIFVTAINTTDLDRLRGYEIGAVDYVSVPVIPEILRAKVSVFVELHRTSRELERANRSLAEGEQRMRAVLETATDAIVTMNARGMVLTVNPATERIFGYDAREMIGMSIERLMPFSWGPIDDLMNENGKAKPFTGIDQAVQGVRKDGSVVPLEVALNEALPGAVFTAIIRDIGPRKRLEREITEIAAAEQRRIGQALHDGVSQELTGLRMMASVAKNRLDRERDAAETLLSRVIEGLSRVHEQVRHISHGLVPVELDAAGLRAALKDLAERIRRDTGIACTFHCPHRVFVRDALTATNLYHIAQEATNNALRHSQPEHIDIRMDAASDVLSLSIQDDGPGFPRDQHFQEGVGLRIMRHRASLIDGILYVGPAPQHHGTLVSCTLRDRRLNNSSNGDE